MSLFSKEELKDYLEEEEKKKPKKHNNVHQPAYLSAAPVEACVCQGL